MTRATNGTAVDPTVVERCGLDQAIVDQVAEAKRDGLFTADDATIAKFYLWARDAGIDPDLDSDVCARWWETVDAFPTTCPRCGDLNVRPFAAHGGDVVARCYSCDASFDDSIDQVETVGEPLFVVAESGSVRLA